MQALTQRDINAAHLLWGLEEHRSQRLEQCASQRRQVVKDICVDSAGADCMRRDARSLRRESPLQL